MHNAFTCYLIGLVVTSIIVALASLGRLRDNPTEFITFVVTLAVVWPLTVVVGLIVFVSNVLNSFERKDST